MKKATFIVVVLLLTLSLAGCSRDQKTLASMQEQLQSIQERLDSIENRISALEEQRGISNDSAVDTPVQNSSDESSADSKVAVEKKTIIHAYATDPLIPQISLENEKIKASIVFCGQSFDLSTSSEDMREHVDSLTLPYYGEPIVRNCDVVLSGVTVNAIYRIGSGNWTPIEGLQFDPVDNTYLVPLYIEGTDTNVFMVQTVNGSHYYFGIRSKY